MTFHFTSKKNKIFKLDQAARSIKRLTAILILFAFTFQNEKLFSQVIDVNALHLGDRIFSSGRYLIDHENGLHLIDAGQKQNDTIFVAVHGFRSQGYEWIYALKKMTATNNRTYFYRWDWTRCPDQASSNLYNKLKDLLILEPQIKHVTLFGHSYGGSIVTGISGMPNLGSIEIHSIAGALIPMKRLKKNCPYFLGFQNHKSLYPHFQWRTVKDQDGAFKNLPFDPQVIEIDGSKIIQLPSKRLDGSRLGHNRSITWVIDSYFNN